MEKTYQESVARIADYIQLYYISKKRIAEKGEEYPDACLDYLIENKSQYAAIILNWIPAIAFVYDVEPNDVFTDAVNGILLDKLSHDEGLELLDSLRGFYF